MLLLNGQRCTKSLNQQSSHFYAEHMTKTCVSSPTLPHQSVPLAIDNSTTTKDNRVTSLTGYGKSKDKKLSKHNFKAYIGLVGDK